MDFWTRLISRIVKTEKNRRRWKSAATCISCIIVFTTVYLLILPAITIDHKQAEKMPGLDVGSSSGVIDDEEMIGEEDVESVTEGETSVDELIFDDSDEEQEGAELFELDAADLIEDDELFDDFDDFEDFNEDESELVTEGSGEESEEAQTGAAQIEAAQTETESEIETGNITEESETETESITESETETESITETESETEEVPELPAQSFRSVTRGGQVEVEADEGAFPAGTTMRVKEVRDEEIINTVTGAAELETSGQVSHVYALDITFYNADGEVIQPLIPIRVNMTAKEAPAEEETPVVVHMDENGSTDLIDDLDVDAVSNNSDRVEIGFDAESFSVYAVVYTVDFTWEVDGEVYEFSFAGGETISLRELTDILHISDSDTDEFVENIEDVWFSDESLIKVAQVTENITAGKLKEEFELEPVYSAELTKEQIEELDAKELTAPDWALISLKDFDTEETLTVTMRNGEEFTVKVTDARLQKRIMTAGGETYVITVTYDETAGIPDDADLDVREILPEDEEYASYYERAASAVAGDKAAKEESEAAAEDDTARDDYARFFDIEIKSNGQKIEPEGDVSVDISLADVPAEDQSGLKVVHFEDNRSDVPDILDAEESVNEEDGSTELTFVTDSFSVYGVITSTTPNNDNDLGGKSFTISHNGQYLLSNIVNNGTTDLIGKTNNAASAAVWYFEDAGEARKYKIYTLDDQGNKKYMRLDRRDPNRAHGHLESQAQVFTVTKNWNGTYTFTAESNGTYYLNEYNNDIGFAGWFNKDSNHDELNLTPSPALENNQKYMVIVKRGENYYIVLNDGTLEEVSYDPTDNSVMVDNPMLWQYTGNLLYHNSKEVGFDNVDLPSDFYRCYIDPASATGLNEDNSSNIRTYGQSGVESGIHVYYRALEDQARFNYTDSKLQSTSNTNYYIGVEEKNGKLKLKGQVSSGDAAEIIFAKAVNVVDPTWTENAVGHIDISIQGTAAVDVPLAYGKYYDENHEVIMEIDSFKKLHLEAEQVVDPESLIVTPDDMKRSTISAYLNNGESLNDAFYVSGYSGNPVHEGSGVQSTAQVRIEGSFLTAYMPEGSEYEQYAHVISDRYYSNGQYKAAVHAARKANIVDYNVTVIKEIEFWLQMDDPEHPGQKIQLYDADGNKLKIKADVAFSDSFNYWDPNNECPPLKDEGASYYYSFDEWQDGGIAPHNGSGMDFKLGGNAQTGVQVYALEITKIVVDENGNRIKSNNAGTNKFYIYGRPTSGGQGGPVPEAALVKDLDVGSFTEIPNYGNYTLQGEKTIRVGNEGLGLVYDYDVRPGLFYVEEDPSTIEDQITDTTGKTWDYKNTYILTEYAWRNHANDNFMHVSDVVTKADAAEGSAKAGYAYKAIPEVLGSHYGYNGTDGPYTNDFLEFYVYNVYESPKVDVPVIKTWEAFEDDEYDWQASFKLQWAPLYPDEATPNTNFLDVTPIQALTITKSDMTGITQELIDRYLAGDSTLTDEEINKIESVTFKHLPKYGTDSNGNTYRIQYSLEETSYRVTNTSTGVIVYSWSENDGYNDPDESTHFQPFYPHDAGETVSGNTSEQNEEDTNYYIHVSNAPKNIREKEFIDIDVAKIWDESFGQRQNDWYAEFELKRFVHTEYRDLSHMTDSDRAAEPVALTVKDSNNEIISTFQALPNLGLFLGCTFAPHEGAKTVTFTANPAVTMPNGARVSTITVTAEGSNASNALVRSQEFLATHDTVFTIVSGEENLASGNNRARVLDTSSGSPPLPDRTFSEIIRLDNTNNWKAHLEDFIRSETHSGDDDDNENVTCYEYYLVEKESNPDGYAQYFRADADGNPTTVYSGDSDHQIETDASIIAVNGPSTRLIVQKVWRGIPDTTGFPGITFTLYQTWEDDQNGNGWVYENETTQARYEHIELKGHNQEWICPEDLPKTKIDTNGVSHNVKYYVLEDDRSGSQSDGSITTSWQFFYYLNSKGIQTNAGHQGHTVALTGSELAENGGTITICNKLQSYIQMDIQKQFFEIGAYGSWGNTTAERARNTVLGFKVIRAIKTSDGKWLDQRGNESDTPVWSDYSGEMLCGYGPDGEKVVKRDDDDIFWLWGVGNTWEFRIENNWGDETNVNAGGSGLASYGFYIRNGEDIPVEYWYSYRETNVYKDLDRTPYPEWSWFSSVTPIWAYGPGQEKMVAFPQACPGQDAMRVANYQASDLIIEKEWFGERNPDAKAVYIKLWREDANGQMEDFTAVIAEDVRNNNNWQNYLDDTSVMDLNRDCLILKTGEDGNWSTSLKVNRALVGTFENGTMDSKEYHYYIQEIGYRTNSGEYRTDVNGRFKPLYDHWVGSADSGSYTGAPVGMSDYADNNITIGAKGENRLKVINRTTPSTSYIVTKSFHGPQSSTGGQSSVTGKYPTDGSKQVVVMLQQRYRYEKTENGVEYVSADYENWVEKTSAVAANTWTVDWQAAESASPVSVTLPLEKPEGSILSDEAWYGSATAWTYTWEGLDVTKVISEAMNPDNTLQAQLYYRAVEISTPDWFISSEEANGHQAIDDNDQRPEEIPLEKNSIVNEREDCEVHLDKEWTSLGGDKLSDWPEGYVVTYQLVQNYHLVELDATQTAEDTGNSVVYIDPVYSFGPTFKSVDMTTSYGSGETADNEHTQAVSTIEDSDGITVTGLPMYGFFTATPEDVEEAATKGVTLTEGTTYPIVYTYSAREIGVTKNGEPVNFSQQTVETQRDETITEYLLYKATLSNELDFFNLSVKKKWTQNGEEASWPEGASIYYTIERVATYEPEEGDPVELGRDDYLIVDAQHNSEKQLTEEQQEVTFSGLDLHGIFTLTENKDDLPAGDYVVTYSYVVKENTASVVPEETEYVYDEIIAQFQTDGEDAGKYVITNDYTDVKLIKTWQRNSDTENPMEFPEGYKVAWKLIRTDDKGNETEIANSGVFIKSTDEGETTITLDNTVEGNEDRRLTSSNQSIDISFLPTSGIVDGETVSYTYSFVEVPEYSEKPETSSYEYTEQTAVAEAGTDTDEGKMLYTLVNDLTDVDVTKTWEGEPNAESVTVKLYRTTDPAPVKNPRDVVIKVTFDQNANKVTSDTINVLVNNEVITLVRNGEDEWVSEPVQLSKGKVYPVTFGSVETETFFAASLPENASITVTDGDDTEQQTAEFEGSVTGSDTCEVIITVNLTDVDGKATGLTADIGDQTVNFEKNGDTYVGAVILNKDTTYEANFRGSASDDYEIIVDGDNTGNLAVGTDDIQSVSFNGIVSAPITGRSITLTINWTGEDSWTGTLWSNVCQYQSDSDAQDVNGNKPEFNEHFSVSNYSQSIGNLTAEGHRIILGEIDNPNLTNYDYFVDIGTISNRWDKQLVLDIPGSENDQSVTVTISKRSSEKPTGTGSITIVNQMPGSGYWYNPLMHNRYLYGNNGYLNGNSSVVFNNLPAGEFTVQTGVTDVSQISGASYIEDWNGSTNIHIQLGEGESKTITISPASRSNGGERTALRSVPILYSKVPVLRASAPIVTRVELGHAQVTVEPEIDYAGDTVYPDFSGMTPLDTQILTVDSTNEAGTVTWYYKWSDLPAKDPETGKTYHYYVVEDIPENTESVLYTLTDTDGTKVTIRNTPVIPPEYGSFQVTKVVNGTETDRSFTIRLKREKNDTTEWLQYTSSSEDGHTWGNEADATTWTFKAGDTISFTGLDLGYTYTAVEDTSTGLVEVNGYDFSNSSTTTASAAVTDAHEEYTGTIINRYTPSTIDIPVVKTWMNAEPSEGDYVKIGLFDVSGETPVNQPGTETPYVLTISYDAENHSWPTDAVSFEDLPMYDSGGNAITYTIKEIEVKLGETHLNDATVIKRVFGNADGTVTSTNVSTVTINNTVQTTSIKGEKDWIPSTLPENTSVELTLTATVPNPVEGEAPVDVTDEVLPINVSRTQLISGDGSFEWTPLPEYYIDGREITYSITETKVAIPGTPGWEGNTADADSNPYLMGVLDTPATDTDPRTITFTNDYTDYSVEKIWDVVNSDISYVIQVKLKQGESDYGDPVTIVKDTETGKWEYTWNYLPKGNSETGTYTYTAREIGVYASSQDMGGTDNPNLIGDFVVTNTDLTDSAKTTIINKLFEIHLLKVDADNSGKTLGGAKFILKKEQNGSYVEYIAERTTPTSDDETTGEVKGRLDYRDLPVGNYELEETEAPPGYSQLTRSIKFEITAAGTIDPDSGNDGDAVSFDQTTFTFTVKNKAGAELPASGGIGTRLYVLSGGLLILLSALAFLLRKRKYIPAVSERSRGDPFDRVSWKGGGSRK